MSISFLLNCTIVINQLSDNFSDFSTLFIIYFRSLFFLTKFPISSILMNLWKISWKLINFLFRWSKLIDIQIWCVIWIILKEWFRSISSIICSFFQIKISLVKSPLIITWFIIFKHFRWTFKISRIGFIMSESWRSWLISRFSSNR